MASQLEAEVLEGEFRAPHNGFQESKGSIHNDEIASKLGFKGGTVPGSVHMDQFAPLLIQVYGDAWFKQGNMSLFFTQATTDREPVKAALRRGEPRCELRMYNEAGEQVCMGTAANCAIDEKSELEQRLAKQAAATPEALRILRDYAIGDVIKDIPMRISREALERSLTRITEDLPAYARDGVLPPSHIVRLAHISRPQVLAKAGKAVGLFGALEIRIKHGPLHAEHDYLGRTVIRKMTESPKTESIWYDVDIADAASKKDVATVTFMIRYMKASSELWR